MRSIELRSNVLTCRLAFNTGEPPDRLGGYAFELGDADRRRRLRVQWHRAGVGSGRLVCIHRVVQHQPRSAGVGAGGGSVSHVPSSAGHLHRVYGALHDIGGGGDLASSCGKPANMSRSA